MPADLLNALFSNLWAVFLIVLFFGGSIFVHELGHFLAARRRGVHVSRFSIGFGPKMFGWRGKDGVEYRVSWLPLGGYVALPQLADMAAVEGNDDRAEDLPPVSYSTRMLVFVMGATFNLIFAFLLATIIWLVGQPTTSDQATTQIGYVVDEIETSTGETVPSPARQAGLEVGDTIRAIDGSKVDDWQELLQTLVTSAGRTDAGRRYNVFTVERDGQSREVTVFPQIAGDEEIRKVGIIAAYELIVAGVAEGSAGAALGLQVGDRFIAMDDTRILNIQTYADHLAAHHDRPIAVHLERDGQPLTLTMAARPEVEQPADLGLQLTTDSKLVYPTPFAQFSDHVRMTFRTLGSLINPQSDIGISKLSGPVGIIRVFHMAAQADIRLVLWFTILVNINLAIFNLLPIPVLDGGHMLFATIGKLRGRALPTNFIMTTQSVFMMMLLSMILYVSFFDVRRIVRDVTPTTTEDPADTK
ncbi:RIP metalloprotease RseP [Synoicihabitans lomoniglobus]|uniref:Zinc metalloprotease n=1 Tax=Synoicihabitans lomoniglobus TaxID=2909285 RepID=A0AAE9ZSV6_9BACT|nr:RIP metalloprotease RseP [Opitutaceae bacterium LMO-M01]WED63537.1 RIP metalloprotease RseP [Opitutaceae bacterium LMO-M01]